MLLINKYKKYIIKYIILLIIFFLYIYLFDYINECISCSEIDTNKSKEFKDFMSNSKIYPTYDYIKMK